MSAIGTLWKRWLDESYALTIRPAPARKKAAKKKTASRKSANKKRGRGPAVAGLQALDGPDVAGASHRARGVALVAGEGSAGYVDALRRGYGVARHAARPRQT